MSLRIDFYTNFMIIIFKQVSFSYKSHHILTCIELGTLDNIIENSGEFNWNKATMTADASFLTSALFGSEIHVTILDTANRMGAELTKSLASMRAIRPRVY